MITTGKTKKLLTLILILMFLYLLSYIVYEFFIGNKVLW